MIEKLIFVILILNYLFYPSIHRVFLYQDYHNGESHQCPLNDVEPEEIVWVQVPYVSADDWGDNANHAGDNRENPHPLAPCAENQKTNAASPL